MIIDFDDIKNPIQRFDPAACEAIWCLQSLVERQTIDLTILPLKAASAIFIDAPGQPDDLLIDCGNHSSAALVLKPFLQAQGVNRLARLLLTYGDLNHVGGTEIIRQNSLAAQINISPVRFRSVAYRPTRFATSGE